jgi:hypothetical protein
VESGTASGGGTHGTAADTDVPGVFQILDSSEAHPDMVKTAASNTPTQIPTSCFVRFLS